MAIADLIPQEASTNTALIPTEGTWTPYASAEDTLRHIAINHVNSYKTILENCRIIYEAQKFWSGRNEVTTYETQNGSFIQRKTDDWHRFKKSLSENFGIADTGITSMSKVWKNFSEKGSIYTVLEKSKFLPNSQTSLYEISTINKDDDEGKIILEKICKAMRKDAGLSLTEIRNIKKIKGSGQSAETQSTEDSQFLSVTKLSLPKSQEDLQKVASKWLEIEEAINKINNLGLIKINFETPTSLIQEYKDKENFHKLNKTLTDWKRFIRRSVVQKLTENELESLKMTEKKKGTDSNGISKSLTKADKDFNARIDGFISALKNPVLAKRMDQCLSDWKQEMKNNQERAKLLEEEFSLLGFKEHIELQESSVKQETQKEMSEDSMKSLLKSRD